MTAQPEQPSERDGHDPSAPAILLHVFCYLLALVSALWVASGWTRDGCTGAGGERDDVCLEGPGAWTAFLPLVALLVLGLCDVVAARTRRPGTDRHQVFRVVGVTAFLLLLAAASGLAVER